MLPSSLAGERAKRVFLPWAVQLPELIPEAEGSAAGESENEGQKEPRVFLYLTAKWSSGSVLY